MNNLKTFEGFFKDLFKGKDSTKNTEKGNTKNAEKTSASIRKFNIFNKQDDNFAEKVFNSLKKSIESEEKPRVGTYGDYKRKVDFKSKDGSLYNISVQKSLGSKSLLSSGDNFILIVNNRHFIDRKTGVSTISQSLLKKIWNLLDKEQDRKWVGREKMEKDFE